MIRVLAISGSLRKASVNTAVLLAADQLAPPGVEVVLYRDLAILPLFNPDVEATAMPRMVAELREAVGRCDALLICSPEYARGVSGALKNALDWLVGSHEFPRKLVAVINASERATDADAHLRLTLETMSASTVADASITLPLLGTGLDAPGIVADEAFAEPLRAALRKLAEAAADQRGDGHVVP